MIFKWLVLFLICLLFGCGPGALDYMEKIGKTELIYIDSNTLHRSIVKPSPEGGTETLIGSMVLAYRIEENYIFGTRQMVNSYICDLTPSDVEVTDKLEFFVIEVSENKPRYNTSFFHNFSELKNYLAMKKINSESLEELSPASLKNYILPAHPLGECENAKLIN